MDIEGNSEKRVSPGQENDNAQLRGGGLMQLVVLNFADHENRRSRRLTRRFKGMQREGGLPQQGADLVYRTVDMDSATGKRIAAYYKVDHPGTFIMIQGQRDNIVARTTCMKAHELHHFLVDNSHVYQGNDGAPPWAARPTAVDPRPTSDRAQESEALGDEAGMQLGRSIHKPPVPLFASHTALEEELTDARSGHDQQSRVGCGWMRCEADSNSAMVPISRVRGELGRGADEGAKGFDDGDTKHSGETKQPADGTMPAHGEELEGGAAHGTTFIDGGGLGQEGAEEYKVAQADGTDANSEWYTKWTTLSCDEQ